jgi:hypothetical protein
MKTYSPFSAWSDVRDLELKPISGGPVVLDPTQLNELFMIPWLVTHSEAHPSLRFSEDPGKKWKDVEARYRQEDEGFVVGHDVGGGRWQSLKDVRDISTLLLELPEGLEMELFTATDYPEGRQRYVGSIKGGKWEIDRSHPSMDSQTLTAAMQFASREPIEMPTEEQAQRAAEVAQMDLDGTFMNVLREGKLLTGLMRDEPDESVTEIIRGFAFAVAFEEGPWSFQDLDEEEEDEELAELTAQLNAALTQPDPTGKALVYAGQFGRYFPGDLLSMPTLIEQDRKILDQEMQELGFESLGELTCNKMHNMVLRGYAGGDGCYAIGQASYGGMFVVEFYTAFVDGSSVTTSTNPHVSHIPKKKIYRSSHCALEPEGLLREHEKALAKHGQKAKSGAATLEGLAQAIDEYMERQGPMWY